MGRKSNDEANRIYRYVIEELSRITKLKVRESMPHIIEVPDPFNWHFYTRISTSGFWALSPNKTAKVEKRHGNSWSILLINGRIDNRDHEKVVLLGIHCISSRVYHSLAPFWTVVSKQYRINEGQKDLPNIPSFPSLEGLISRLSQNRCEFYEQKIS